MGANIVKWSGRDRIGWPRGAFVWVALGLFPIAAGVASADVLSQIQSVRENGCDGRSRYEGPLERLNSLDVAARLWANGTQLRDAMDGSGYNATEVSALHVRGSVEALSGNDQSCRTIRDSALRHVGVYQTGADTWFVLAAPAHPASARGSRALASSVSAASAEPSALPGRRPAAAVEGVPAAPEGAVVDEQLPERVLDLVNNARDQGRRCGERYLPAAAPIRLSAALSLVASQHAVDMAQHGYFEHVDLDGRTPAERVKAAGYRERLVGENIAYGPTSAEEVVAGWLGSPGHCENIMDPRFLEMGLALAPGAARPRGFYWVQVLAQPAVLTGRR